ncbi:DUF2971 domain-containing protein [Leptospira sp. GIMC2001]|uniref:DUF2971 domain-containing protein n=1 Tax=Leptospira sp. GIMC2001 TaxID=1513297 RepID=UPI00234B7B70|nr:DUF2971 domain-containing protein [Leptospira sp. GIMC2001]WCL51056.1 DUF2971 domain-containing protein [Leptospira sp. GIMC2001]
MYKYFPFSHNALDSLKNNYLYFNDPSQFNDPFDCQVNIYFKYPDTKYPKLNADEINNFGLNRSIIKKGIEADKTQQSKFNLNHRICCFSYINTNLLMWSHYAESHFGYCLEFEVEKAEDNVYKLEIEPNQLLLNNSDYNNNIFIKKVTYSNRKSNYFNGLSSEYNKLADIFMKKSKDWKYEEEFRSIYQKSSFACDERKIYYKKNKLRAIYFGINMIDCNKSKIIQIFKENTIEKLPIFYSAYRSEESYKIIFLEENIK